MEVDQSADIDVDSVGSRVNGEGGRLVAARTSTRLQHRVTELLLRHNDVD